MTSEQAIEAIIKCASMDSALVDDDACRVAAGRICDDIHRAGYVVVGICEDTGNIKIMRGIAAKEPSANGDH
jgi:hypothetical protein